MRKRYPVIKTAVVPNNTPVSITCVIGQPGTLVSSSDCGSKDETTRMVFHQTLFLAQALMLLVVKVIVDFRFIIIITRQTAQLNCLGYRKNNNRRIVDLAYLIITS